MAVEHRKIEGDIEVDSKLFLHGMVTGNITVVGSGILYLHGTCSRDLVVEEGAEAYVHGTVGGSVHNRGGYLEVYGTVYGYLHTEEGNTLVDPDAVVKRRV